MPRWIIRPRNISTTPRELATRLRCQTRKYPSVRNIRRGFSWTDDFFLVYPDPDYVRTAGSDTQTYHALYRFFSQSKAGQRLLLKQSGLPVPETTTRKNVAATWLVPETESPTSFVVRPLRHSGGQGFRCTTDPTDFIEGEEYVQRLFPKTREYRLIYVKGKLCVCLRKKVEEGTRPDVAWNHATGSRFQTLADPGGCKLGATDCFVRLTSNPVILAADIVAVDVLWNRSGYVICEFNSCPGLSIEGNTQKVIQYVHDSEVIHRSDASDPVPGGLLQPD